MLKGAAEQVGAFGDDLCFGVEVVRDPDVEKEELGGLDQSPPPGPPPGLELEAEEGVDGDRDRGNHPALITKADGKKRVVLPAARPGDVFDIQQKGEGQFLLVRLQRPEPKPRMSRSTCLRAIAASPLRPRMGWDTLKGLTREP